MTINYMYTKLKLLCNKKNCFLIYNQNIKVLKYFLNRICLLSLLQVFVICLMIGVK